MITSLFCSGLLCPVYKICAEGKEYDSCDEQGYSLDCPQKNGVFLN